MDLSNRTLIVFAAVTGMLVILAVTLTLMDPPQAPQVDASPNVSIIPVVSRTGGSEVSPSGPLTVRRSGGRAGTASLLCDTFRSQRPFEGGVARFPDVPLGDCAIVLDGTDRAYEPVFPGDNLRCQPDGIATECTGGLAASRAARVTITSDLEGTIALDGDELGAIPVFGAPVKIGRRELRLMFPSGESTTWSLLVQPDQNIRVHFPDPFAVGDFLGEPDEELTPAPAPPAVPAPPAPAPEPVRAPERTVEAPPSDAPTGGGLIPVSP